MFAMLMTVLLVLLSYLSSCNVSRPPAPPWLPRPRRHPRRSGTKSEASSTNDMGKWRGDHGCATRAKASQLGPPSPRLIAGFEGMKGFLMLRGTVSLQTFPRLTL